MANVTFENFMRSLERLGVIDVLLPFMLVFTLIFAVLEKTKILGEGKRNMDIGLSIIFALLVVVPHVTGNFPAGYDPVEIINKSLPTVSLLVVAVIALLILIGVFAHDRIMLGLTAPGWIGLFSVVSIIIIFGGAAGWWSSGFMQWLENAFGPDVLALLIMILVFGLIIAFVTGGGEAEKKGSILEKMGIHLNELFKK